MCKYELLYTRCNNELLKEDLCQEHLEKKCSFCGNQAVKECDGGMQGSDLCVAPLCDNEKCKESHMLEIHSTALSYFIERADILDKGTVKVLFGKVIFEDSSVFAKTSNEKMKKRIAQLLLWEDGNGKYKIVGTGGLVYAKDKKELFNMYNRIFGIECVDVYYTDDLLVRGTEGIILSDLELLKEADFTYNQLLKKYVTC